MLTGRVEPIVKRFKPSVLERPDALADSLVQNVHAMPATMSTRDSSGLTVETHTKPTEVAELANLILGERIVVDGNSTLDTPMSGRTTRSKPWGLQRENLVRGELLLVKRLLLLLQRFDLLLDGDLGKVQRPIANRSSGSGLPVPP